MATCIQGISRARRKGVAALFLALALLAGPLAAQTSREYDLKAAFLYNFATFVEWPPAAFAQPDTPVVIGVLGNDPFGSVLDEIVSGERVRGRPLVVRRFSQFEDMHVCHILYICRSESRQLKDILRKLKNQPVLTVGEQPNFVEAGGGIGFTTETRIGLVINPPALRAAGLAVSSKLLRLAQVAKDGGTP